MISFQEHKVDPFACAITIASTCMHIFRKRFLKEETIAIVPNGGYRTEEMQSAIAIKWLKWLSESEDLDIQHARNGHEVKILNYKVDGQLRNTKQIFEFNGCVFHGCPKCFINRKKRLPKSNLTAEEAYTRTMERQKKLEAAGLFSSYLLPFKYNKYNVFRISCTCHVGVRAET